MTLILLIGAAVLVLPLAVLGAVAVYAVIRAGDDTTE